MGSSFKRHLAAWTIHAIINATPSFVIAVQGRFHWLESIAGMVTGIVIYVFALSALSSSDLYQNRIRTSFFGQTVRYGRNIRSGLTLLAGVGWGTWTTVFLWVDFISGYYSIQTVEHLFFELPVSLGVSERSLPDVTDFFPTLCITLLQGALLTIVMLVLAVPVVGTVRLIRKINASRLARSHAQ